MKRTIDPNMPVGKMTRVKDFLPPPEELILTGDNVKVTLALSRRDVAYLKEQAKRNGTKYQRMIRSIVSRYVTHYLARR